MSIFAFGVNHLTAPVAIRERVAFAPERVAPALRDLAKCSGVSEAAIVSTCNRTDLYCELREGATDEALGWFARYHKLAGREIFPYVYKHHAASAVRHLLRVASGLDSLVIGEPQILGQVKDAHQIARATGTVGRNLDRLFQHSFSVAKRVRTETAIGSSPVSVAFAAVSLAKQIFGDLGGYTAMLIGAGETMELAARHLRSNGLERMIIANRTLANAHRLASQLDAYAVALAELPAHLADADIIISSTASETAILGLEAMKAALRARKRRPVFIVDIAVPRDVEPQVGELEDVYLYTVDDLDAVIQDNLQSRQEAAREAEELIETQVEQLMGWFNAQGVVEVIRSYRGQAERTRDEVLARAVAMARKRDDPERALRYLANTLTNKLLHAPTAELRRAGAAGRTEVVDLARALFDIEDSVDPASDPSKDP